MLDKKYLGLMAFLSISLLLPIIDVEASSNPNLFVSAENSQFDNHFSGSMVIEVVVIDPNLSDTGEGKGEPDVTINGKTLRMTQAVDGSWYAYFANVEKAKQADATVGLAGEGLDFGVFCSRDTVNSIIGISLSETDGFTLPRSAVGSTDGTSTFTSCTGAPTGSILNNVVRNAKSINSNPNVPVGQIGLNSNAWPLIQLYSFSDVIIQYNPGGPSQQISLEYDEIPNISIGVDRDIFPENSEVFFTINDFQLNQDPTDEDSWTFNVDSSLTTFYQAYDENGSAAAAGGIGLVNLIPYLSNLGFEDNGQLSMTLNSVLELQSNDEQPSTSISDGTTTFSKIITLVENNPNSGIFDTGDNGNESNLGILNDAPRGNAGSISYNDKSISVLTGTSSATLSLDDPTLTIGNGNQLLPGTEFSVVLTDSDQNINSGSRDDLDVFRSTAIIPTLTIGNPITLENAFDVQFHTTSPTLSGDDSNSSVPDSNSDRLIIDTSNVANSSYEMISVNLGISASSLSSSLLDVSESNTDGTNWINYDFRSLESDYGLSDFGDTSFSLSFGTLGNSPLIIADIGDISSSQGFIQLDDSDVSAISSKSGTVFLVIDFDTSTNDVGIITISNESNKQPVIFDLFSFGFTDSDDINNSIYRFELDETSNNSSIFDGTIEYFVANQLNILDSSFIQTIQTIDDDIKFLITDRLIDDEGISISYSDLDASGVFTPTSSKSDINTNTGIITSDSSSYRFGQPVTLTLNDPDLNLKNDLIDIYFVINDANSDNVDTVGKDGISLFEVLIKDIRYERCTVNGVEYGGLAATGFSLVETGPSTGIFEGIFKMPSKICNKSGDALISSAGGSLDAKYYDSRDDSGNANTFSLLRSPSPAYFTTPQLSSYEIEKPTSGNIEEIILSGSVDNHRRGIPLSVVITTPDGKTQNFAAAISSAGIFRSIITVDEHSLSGVYEIELSHNNSHVKTISFVVSNTSIPDWVKNNAKWWSSNTVTDSEFINGIEHLIEEGLIIVLPGTSISIDDQNIPDWVKNNAKWWADNKISDEDFLKSIQYLVKKAIIRI